MRTTRITLRRRRKQRMHQRIAGKRALTDVDWSRQTADQPFAISQCVINRRFQRARIAANAAQRGIDKIDEALDRGENRRVGRRTPNQQLAKRRKQFHPPILPGSRSDLPSIRLPSANPTRIMRALSVPRSLSPWHFLRPLMKRCAIVRRLFA